jgi:hypothetical protein
MTSMPSDIEIYIGENPLPVRGSAGASISEKIEAARDKLSEVGDQLAMLFAAMRPKDAAAYVGAEVFELEIGFSLELGAGEILRIMLSPKIGMSCKAKIQWKAPALSSTASTATS